MVIFRAAAPAAQLVAFKSFGGIVNLDPIGARHALALAVLAARKVCSAAIPVLFPAPQPHALLLLVVHVQACM